jgi:hypothetical protein
MKPEDGESITQLKIWEPLFKDKISIIFWKQMSE